MRCTRTTLLEVESEVMPLKFRRELLLGKYVGKIATLPNHSVHKLIKDYYHFNFYSTNQRKLSFCGRAHELFSEMKVKFDKISTIPNLKEILPTQEQPRVSSEMAVHKKSSLADSSWRQLFSEMIANYPNHLKIYCDGSVREGRTGFGVWSSEFVLIGRLQDGTSVLTAEMMAIFTAISRIENSSGDFIILTDSLSSVEMIGNLERKDSALAVKIRSALAKDPSQNIHIEWIPSHVQIIGNERADNLAKEATNLPQVTIMNYELADVYKIVQLHTAKKWQRQWDSSTEAFREMKPTVRTQTQIALPRRHQIKITRLRLGTCLFTHEHLFKKTVRKNCQFCGAQRTIEHILVSCPQFAANRCCLQKICTEQTTPMTVVGLLQPNPTILHELINYLQKIKMIEQI